MAGCSSHVWIFTGPGVTVFSGDKWPWTGLTSVHDKIDIKGHFNLQNLWSCSTRPQRSPKHQPTAFCPTWPAALPSRTAAASRTPSTPESRRHPPHLQPPLKTARLAYNLAQL